MARLGRRQPNQNVWYADNIITHADVGAGQVAWTGTGTWAASGSVSVPSSTSTSEDYPALVIEWLPDEGPGVVDGDWVDITEFFAGGKTVRGRQYELDRFGAGTCTLTLHTTDRMFDPEWTAGPFYGQLLPLRQIRITATWDESEYPVFRGYITDWGQTVWQDSVFSVTIEARDAFAVLEQIQLPSSAWALEIQRDEPSMWLRFGETDTVRVTDSAGGNYGIYDNCQQGAPGLVLNDADAGVGFAHSLEERVVIQNPALITGYPFTISAMVKIDGSDPSGFKTLIAALPHGTFDTGHPRLWMAVIDSVTGVPGAVTCRISDNVNQRTLISAAIVADDKPHHLAWVASSGSSFALYIDGVLDASSFPSAGTPTFLPPTQSGWTIGNFTDLNAGDYGFGTNDLNAATIDNRFPLKERGTIDEVCVWDGLAVDDDRIVAHAEAALTVWDGDRTGERVDRFLDKIDWPTELRDIETGVSTLGAAQWSAGANALSVLQAWADTELGAFFVDGSGKIVWRSRHHPLVVSASVMSQATFNDGHSASTLLYQDLALPRDETLIRNPVMASRRDGISVTVKDDTLIGQYGNRSWAAPNSEDQKDSAIRDRAIWLLARYKELGTRLEKMTVAPRRHPASCWPECLGREIGDRITVQRTPLGTGNEIESEQIIERIEHNFAPAEWSTTFAGSPVDPNVGMYLILDDPTTGLIDAGFLLAY